MNPENHTEIKLQMIWEKSKGKIVLIFQVSLQIFTSVIVFTAYIALCYSYSTYILINIEMKPAKVHNQPEKVDNLLGPFQFYRGLKNKPSDTDNMTQSFHETYLKSGKAIPGETKVEKHLYIQGLHLDGHDQANYRFNSKTQSYSSQNFPQPANESEEPKMIKELLPGSLKTLSDKEYIENFFNRHPLLRLTNESRTNIEEGQNAQLESEPQTYQLPIPENANQVQSSPQPDETVALERILQRQRNNQMMQNSMPPYMNNAASTDTTINIDHSVNEDLVKKDNRNILQNAKLKMGSGKGVRNPPRKAEIMNNKTDLLQELDENNEYLVKEEMVQKEIFKIYKKKKYEAEETPILILVKTRNTKYTGIAVFAMILACFEGLFKLILQILCLWNCVSSFWDNCCNKMKSVENAVYKIYIRVTSEECPDDIGRNHSTFQRISDLTIVDNFLVINNKKGEEVFYEELVDFEETFPSECSCSMQRENFKDLNRNIFMEQKRKFFWWCYESEELIADNTVVYNYSTKTVSDIICCKCGNFASCQTRPCCDTMNMLEDGICYDLCSCTPCSFAINFFMCPCNGITCCIRSNLEIKNSRDQQLATAIKLNKSTGHQFEINFEDIASSRAKLLILSMLSLPKRRHSYWNVAGTIFFVLAAIIAWLVALELGYPINYYLVAIFG